jgi:membrane protease subunit HflK
MKRGQEQLARADGRARQSRHRRPRRRSGLGPIFTKQGMALGALALVAVWAFMSFYTVRPEERSVELFLGESSGVGDPGLNFAPWPVVTYEKVQVTGERTTDIGAGRWAAPAG